MSPGLLSSKSEFEYLIGIVYFNHNVTILSDWNG